ncbi:MAG: hypothetical protein JWO18_771 [Microbacteriaceae bacterium]|nr:hypothetical protein [Microbacteriaceae bacterium]
MAHAFSESWHAIRLVVVGRELVGAAVRVAADSVAPALRASASARRRGATLTLSVVARVTKEVCLLALVRLADRAGGGALLVERGDGTATTQPLAGMVCFRQ